MPDLFEGNFFIQVQNSTNPTLGQNGQGVCGVVLQFSHEFVGDLQVTLTAPNGQTVTLMGPTGFFGETDGTTWDVTFLPCSQPAAPDPGFNAVWSNDQNWGLFGHYTGSYYPMGGCLEDFNGGSVNGQWTLSVQDELQSDAGSFFNYEILFCDPAGIECISCAANAGNLIQPDTSFCEKDTALNLTLQPVYPPYPPVPPAPEYAYAYVVASSGIIQHYQPAPDLRSYPPGAYTVCGLSYLMADTANIPAPNGLLTLPLLSAQLNSSAPPFCGKITPNCLNVTILPATPDIYDTVAICAPACHSYYDSLFCSSGDYSVVRVQDGCPYAANLHLTVLQPITVDLQETICAGACAQTPGFAGRCTAGIYSDTLVAENGCDSIVRLHLNVLAPVAAIAAPPQLTCGQASVPLLGTGTPPSTPGISYLWSAGNGGTLTGPADQINASAASAGSYRLISCQSVDGTSCCDTATVQVSANLNPPPTPAVINGPGSICPGQAVSYAVDSVSNSANYTWSVPSGVQLTAGQGTRYISLYWGQNAGGNICVMAGNGCGSSLPFCIPVEVATVPAQPTITGNDTVCAGDTVVYNMGAVSGATGYAWTVSGGTIIGPKDTTSLRVIWDTSPAAGHQVCAQVLNTCGPGASGCLGVIVVPAPAPDAGTDQTVCGLQALLDGSVVSPGNQGSWAKVAGPGDGQWSTAGSAPQVSVSEPGDYTFVWTEKNAGCSVADSVQVRFNPVPSTVSVTPLCDPANESFRVVIPIVGGTPPYRVNTILMAGNQFVSDALGNGSAYQFVVTDANGCEADSIQGSFACACTTYAGQMSNQQLEACPGATVTAQPNAAAVLDGNDTTVFVLHTWPGDSLGQVLAYNGSGTFGFQPGMQFETTYYISRVAGSKANGLPNLNDPCLSVAPGQPVVFHDNPVADAGPDTAFCGNSVILNAQPAAGHWSYSANTSNATLSFDDPYNPKAVITASQPSAFVLTWLVSENGCTASDQVSIRMHPVPKVQNIQYQCDSLNEQYAVQFMLSSGTPPYQVNGLTLPGEYFESLALPTGSSFLFQVVDSNQCSPLAPPAGTHVCQCATSAGTMSPQLLVACGQDSVSVQRNGDQVLDANDVGVFMLHTGDGAVLGKTLAQNTNGVFGFSAGMEYDSTYYVSFVAGNNLGGQPNPNDPCYSVSLGQPVRFLKKPAPVAAPISGVCGLTASLLVGASEFPGQWNQVSGPGTASIAASSAPETQVKVPLPGKYTFQWQEANGQCGAFAEAAIAFNDIPVVDDLKADCNDTNTGFIISFTLNNGTPPFKVDGLNGVFIGNAFLSPAILTSVNYSFTVTDANGCATPPVAGSKNCQCVTAAGSMVTTPAVFCANEPAVATWNHDGNTDGNDSIRFVLHDAPGSALGTVFGISEQPVFTLPANLKPGITYYISAVAGNNAGGQIDFADPCLSVALGAPVQWKALPAVTLEGDTTICAGQTALLHLAGTGDFPLEVHYQDGAGALQSVVLFSAQPTAFPVSPGSTTTFTLTGVTDGSPQACSVGLNDPAVVNIRQPAQAGVAAGIQEFCAGSPQSILLNDLLKGADAGGNWVELSAQPSAPGAFEAAAGALHLPGVAPGVYVFQYRMPALAPCPGDSAEVSIRIRPTPVADAGPDLLLDCFSTSGLIGGAGTSSGAGVQYQWFRNGLPAGNAGTSQLEADTAGIFLLQVTDAFGCSATDQVEVRYAAAPLAVPGIRVEPVRCFGESNGRITVDSVRGGTPPYRFALDGAPLGAVWQFVHLKPGLYTVQVEDAEGCTWASPPLRVEEPPEIKILLPDEIEAALGDSVYLWVKISLPQGALDTIIWQPLIDSAAAGLPYQNLFPVHSGRFQVVVADTNGCVQSGATYLWLNRERRVFIPNTFQPGSDPNGIFQVSGGNDVEEVESLQVFDRWGERVFEARHFKPGDGTQGWDGRFQEKPCPAGVYVYRVTIGFKDGEKEVWTGDVTLLR